MKEVLGNLWDVTCDLRIVTTNGDVNRQGAAVMGRGCALEAKSQVPGIEYHFARRLKEHGNRVMLLAKLPDGSRLASFPVKHHWRDEAAPILIRRSAEQLAALADAFCFERILIPRPGCGNGRLSWEDVRHVLSGVLDDRFSVITFPPRR